MDGSNSASGKKIVFKKRLLGAKAHSNEGDSSVAEEQAPPPSESDTTKFHYQGEVFDQYYRPLRATEGEAALRAIAREEMPQPTLEGRLTKQQLSLRDAREQEFGEALAHQIYHLAQKDREVDIDIYLSAFNVVLADKTPHEAKRVLDRANDFFTEHYYTVIRDRGERPEIYHQIVKRVGHEFADKILKIAKGLDVEATAETLWGLYHGPHPDKRARIADLLLDCTETQVRALRRECMLIPFKSLARQAYALLHASVSDSKAAARRSIGKNEVYEQKKAAAFKARDDMHALRYLFLGRSRDEMAIVKRFFVDLSEADGIEADSDLEARVRRNLSAAEFDRLGSLFEGWSPEQEAKEWNEILFPKSSGDLIEDLLSDPRDAVDRDHTQGLGPFLRRFSKRRMWRDKSSIRDRVLNQYELINERVAALSRERFLASNAALREVYGYDLDPSMFPSLEVFDARRVAQSLLERIPVSSDFLEMLQPMAFLAPTQCAEAQIAFEVLSGRALTQAIEERLSSLQSKLSGGELASRIDRHVHGHGRWLLAVDILSSYRGEDPPAGVWQAEYRSDEKYEGVAVRLAEIMDSDAGVGDLDRPIREVLFERSYDDLHKIERAFYDLTEPRLPLREALRECMSEDAFNAVELLLGGVDAAAVVKRLHDDPLSARELSDLPPSFVSIIRDAFERRYFVSLVEYVSQRFAGAQHEELLVDVLAAIVGPEVFEARSVLSAIRKDASREIDLLRQYWSGPYVRTLAFERAFDLRFPRLRTHLKMLAARQALSAQVFAEFVLCLEGIDPDITQRITECFDAVDIGALMNLLREHKHDQKVLEETYDLLNPNGLFRRCISDMKVDLDLINETLLHLEGYSAVDVATELRGFITQMKGEELGLAVFEVVRVPSAQYPNPRIPEDINWMDEMVYQVAMAYQRLYKVDFIGACREAKAPVHMLEELTTRVYGLEVCASAREIYQLIKIYKEGGFPPEYAEQRICSYLESRGARHRDRLVRAYQIFWGQNPGYGNLLEDISKFFTDSNIKKKVVSLLLQRTSDPSGTSPHPTIVH